MLKHRQKEKGVKDPSFNNPTSSFSVKNVPINCWALSLELLVLGLLCRAGLCAQSIGKRLLAPGAERLWSKPAVDRWKASEGARELPGVGGWKQIRHLSGALGLPRVCSVSQVLCLTLLHKEKLSRGSCARRSACSYTRGLISSFCKHFFLSVSNDLSNLE